MKTIFTICFTSLYIFVSSQIQKIELRKCEEIGHISQGAYDIINEKCNDGNYKFSFRDFNYQKITIARSFEFKDVDNSYINLFNEVINGFENIKDEKAFELPDVYLIIRYMSSLGIKGVSFSIKNKTTGETGFSNFFTKSQIYKLFGIPKNK